MRIKVTKEHINRGYATRNTKAELEGSCPVALAIWEQVPDCLDVFVAYDSVSVTRKSATLSGYFPCSESMRKFIRDFDGYRPVVPTAFNIPLEA